MVKRILVMIMVLSIVLTGWGGIVFAQEEEIEIAFIRATGEPYYQYGSQAAEVAAKKLGVKLDEKDFVIVDKQQRTNVKGVYAAGDITGGLRQVVTACAEGAIAALSSTEALGKQYPY